MIQPGRQIVTAGYFVPAAEQMGIVHLVDRFALETAVGAAEGAPAASPWRSMSRARRRPIRPGCKALSIMCATMATVANRLIVELTETAALHHFEENARFVSQLRELGVRVAIDDFGAGYHLIPQSADAACRYGQDRRLLCQGSVGESRKTRSLCAPWWAWPRIST